MQKHVNSAKSEGKFTKIIVNDETQTYIRERFLSRMKRMDYLSDDLGSAAQLVESAEDGLMQGWRTFIRSRANIFNLKYKIFSRAMYVFFYHIQYNFTIRTYLM